MVAPILLSHLLALAIVAIGPDDSPRAARSVHLRYPAPEASLFYNELTVTRSTPGSYFMACGFSGGYFGIQQLEDGRKLVLFSAWDPGKQDDPDAVPRDKQVEIIYQNPAVKIQRFGGEGTGAQCLFNFDWSNEKTYCFAVRARRDGDRTSYAAYFRPKDAKMWEHLATFRRATEQQQLTGLYSFIEDFRRDHTSATEIRSASFGNGWIEISDGKWERLVKAQFNASSASWEAKDTIDAGVDHDHFLLQTGGETKQHTKLGEIIEREPGSETHPDVPRD